MSRVEPKNHPQPARRQAEPARRPPAPTPGKAEGEERTVDQALRQERK